MKRIWLYVIGVVLVAAAIVAVIIAMNGSKDHSDKPNTKATGATGQSTAFPQRKACGIFTLADAKQILGDSAKGGENGTPTSSGDLEVSTCSYTQDAGNNAPVSGSKSATLLVRAPKTGVGTTSNQNQFGYLKPAGSQPVTDYGDSAYWDPQYGQLNILKHNSWYVLSNGPITPSERTLDQAKALADILISKM
jgi:hypothetical protein